MEFYINRLHDFLISSILDIKNKSGTQRWYLICDDVLNLFLSFKKTISFTIISEKDFYSFLLNPLYLSDNKEAASLFKLNLQEIAFQNFMMIVLQALLDPPTSWWKHTQDSYDLKSLKESNL